MGMFDNISVSEGLPFNDEMKELGIDINNLSYQTKDLDCLMDSYIIQGGKLFVQKYKSEDWIEGNKDSKNVFDRIGHLKRSDPYYEEVNFHGNIYFYEFLNNVKGKWDCWIEYKAVFTKNKLTSLELFKFTKEDNSDRLKREEEWREKIEAENKKWYNKYFLHTYPVRRVRRAIGTFFNRLGNLCHQISYKL